MSLFRHRDFRLLFVGQGVSRLGDGLYTAAIAWLAWSLTHQPGAVALVTAAAYGPTFMTTLIGASYADRYDRRRLMIATDVVRAVVVAITPLLLALGLLNLTLLVAAVALLSLVGAPFAPARNAIVPEIVPAERLLEANGLLQVAFRAAFFVGPLLGAFRLPLGLAETPVVAGVLLGMTGFASALTDIPLIALVQQRIPDRHLAKALGLWEAGVAGALALSPFVAAVTIEQVGVRSAFMLSGAALIALGATAAITLTRVSAGPARRPPHGGPLASLEDGHRA